MGAGWIGKWRPAEGKIARSRYSLLGRGIFAAASTAYRQVKMGTLRAMSETAGQGGDWRIAGHAGGLTVPPRAKLESRSPRKIVTMAGGEQGWRAPAGHVGQRPGV